MGKITLQNDIRLLFNGTNLSAVTTATVGDTIDLSNYKRVSWFVNCTVNTGAVTVTTQGSIDGTIWRDLDTVTYTGAIGSNDYHYGHVTYYPLYRTKTTTQSNSTVTTTVVAYS